MTRDQLGARVRGLIEEHLANTPRLDGKDWPPVTDDVAMVYGLGLDSLDLVEVTMAVEDAFDIELDDEQVAELVTVRDLIDHLVAKLAVPA